jgi:hypothetical protein
MSDPTPGLDPESPDVKPDERTTYEIEPIEWPTREPAEEPASPED